MKALIFDSGTLINLSMNGFLYILENLKKLMKGKFIITHTVKYEVIDHPSNVQRFELGAVRIQNLLDHGIIELPEILGISKEKISTASTEFMEKANHAFQVRGTWVTLVSEAEMSCLALSQILSQQGHETIIAIDERTTRALCEKPQTLEQIMATRLHQRVQLVAPNLDIFKDHRFIRSSELVYVAYKKGILGLEGKKALEAALYATKYKGAAISFEEIEELKKL